ncbi:hypothetical protein RDI58_017416 [Solanum bulbocastanum]|uniref:DDE Tnp4 domain-containing protein n=1 Tax=Solanum bulbocastanum TaxID=147425 RepID=A0AAN8TEZ1_SOLBU
MIVTWGHLAGWIDDHMYTLDLKDCIGTIDGTYIEGEVPKVVQQAYRNRKGRTSQNVLCACDFDKRFTFVAVGWEGTPHDSKVLENALVEPTSQFPFPPYGNFKLHP